MRLRRLLLVLGLTLAASFSGAAWARGWQGVTPGVTTEDEVAARFGQPSTRGKPSGRMTLVYRGEQAIPGTRQAQFYARDDGVVVEVVVFPANQLDKDTVEGTYGKPSQKAFTDDFRTVWIFKSSGITVYFGKEGTVDAISFKAPEAGKAAPAKAAEAP
jgi:hypothetical protein